MTTLQIAPPPVAGVDATARLATGFPILFARLLARATALVGDADEAEDIAQEALIAGWQADALTSPPVLDRLVADGCRCWQARRRALRSALGRLVAAGGTLPSWLTGPAEPAAADEAVLDIVLLRLTIGERLGVARDPDPGADDAAAAGSSDVASRSPRASWPSVPADLAGTRPIAAALVRAGAPVAPTSPTPATATRRRRRGRAGPDQRGGVTAELTAALVRHDRLRAQLPERERAAERAARRLDELRRRFDRACTAEARVAAETALLAAAVRHERAQAARRDLARRLADLLGTPGLADALARRRRR